MGQWTAEMITRLPKAKELVRPGRGPCIYLLFKKERLVYVGQSICLENRLNAHSFSFEFDRVFYIEVDSRDAHWLNELERAFIIKMCPTLNQAGKKSPLSMRSIRLFEKYTAALTPLNIDTKGVSCDELSRDL